MRKSVRFAVPATWTNDARGNWFEQFVGKLLVRQRYKVIERIRFTGMELDLYAEHVDLRHQAFVECKFLQDPVSAPVLDALLGKALRKGCQNAMLYTAGPLGKEAKGAFEELKADSNLAVRLAVLGPDDLLDSITEVYGLGAPSLDTLGVPAAQVQTSTLLCAPDLKFYWLHEVVQDGIPQKLLVSSATPQSTDKAADLQAKFAAFDDYSGLHVIDAERSTSSDQNETPRKLQFDEVIAPVGEAESLQDYRPCRPSDFIGRKELQKDLVTFLDSVIESRTETRVFAVSGPSGYGKSSLVLKVADRLKNKRWRNKSFCFTVDVRSAKGPLFVPQAFRTALQAATRRFEANKSPAIEIDNIRDPLASENVERFCQLLADTNRVVVIIFDQFEELLTKPSLFDTFQAFERLALQIDANKAPIVLGFCWRTGLSLSEEHPAYHLWQNLRDKRRDFRIDSFSASESGRVLVQFEQAFGIELESSLRRRLLEQCQGFPWFLKKLCVHVFSEIKRGVRQTDLIAQQLNIRKLFDEDLEGLSRDQVACLKYVAANAPIDMIDLLDRFPEEIIQSLYGNRLLVRTGTRWVVYWDIFRDYLTTGTVPAIPSTYLPQQSLKNFLRALLDLGQRGRLELKEYASELGFNESTTANLFVDLVAFGFAHRTDVGVIEVTDNGRLETVTDISNALRLRWQDHVIVDSMKRHFVPGQRFNLSEFYRALVDAFPSGRFSDMAPSRYGPRLIPWLRLIGELHVEEETKLLYMPQTDALQTERLADIFKKSLYGQSRSAMGVFLCTSGPSQCSRLADVLCEESILESDARQMGLRNAAADLVALGLARRNGGLLEATPLLLSRMTSGEGSLQTVLMFASQTAFIETVREANSLGLSRTELPSYVRQRMRRAWTYSSASRYVTAAQTWLKHLEQSKLVFADVREPDPQHGTLQVDGE